MFEAYLPLDDQALSFGKPNIVGQQNLAMKPAALPSLQQELGVTMIYRPLDRPKAAALTDLIILMRGGTIEQIGMPQQIYDAPIGGFVAEFIGYDADFILIAGGFWGEGDHKARALGASYASGGEEHLLPCLAGPLKAETPANGPCYEIGSDVTCRSAMNKAALLVKV